MIYRALIIVAFGLYLFVPGDVWQDLASDLFAPTVEESESEASPIPEPTGQFVAIADSIRLALLDDMRSRDYPPSVAHEAADYHAGLAEILERDSRGSEPRLRTLSALAAFREAAGLSIVVGRDQATREFAKASLASEKKVFPLDDNGLIRDQLLVGDVLVLTIDWLNAIAWGAYQAGVEALNAE